MSRTVCWKCQATVVMSFHGRYDFQEEQPGARGFTSAAMLYQCPGCHYPSIGIVVYDDAWDTSDPLERDEIEWLPQGATGKKFPHVPEHIAAAADEAYRCQSIRVHRAAVLMCRSVIEATAKDKGITSGSLSAKIDEMEKHGLVRPLLKEAAHEIRHLGNDMAHGDFIDPVSQAEADEILNLMSEVLNEVYQMPARVAQRKQARLNKGATAISPPPTT